MITQVTLIPTPISERISCEDVHTLHHYDSPHRNLLGGILEDL